MNNEPVAWMLETDRGNISCYVKPSDEFNWIPLYTHPVKTDKAELDTRSYMLGYADGKEAKTLTPLTDDEIEIECRKAWNLNDQYRLNLEEVIRFAHAILRKAQEK